MSSKIQAQAQAEEDIIEKTAGGFGESENVSQLMRDKLASSGLTAEDGVRFGMTCRGETTLRKAFPWAWKKPSMPALIIPYFGIDGKLVRVTKAARSPLFVRLRALRDFPEPLPIAGEKKKPVKPPPKYLQSPGSGPRAYFPPDVKWLEVLKAKKQRIIITEGELKALKSSKEGLPTIGLGGASSFSSKKRGVDLIADLAAIDWNGVEVVIIFDSDPNEGTREEVERERQRLADLLIKRGAKVFYVDLPDIGLDGKIGLDDYLLHCSAADLQTLVDDAVPMKFNWRSHYLGSEEHPLCNLANAAIALRHAPELIGCFRFDEMARGVVVVRALPGTNEEPASRPLTDQDVRLLQEWLQVEGLLETIAETTVWSAIQTCAHENAFHPVRDYLDGCKWDKKYRLNSLLQTYLGALDAPAYLRAAGRMFLIGMVARIFEPGCKLDTVLVLEGDQGIKKSMTLAILGGPWFGDALPDLHDKDLRQYLRGKWLVEIAELAAIAKSDNEPLKAFITRRVEDYRPSYGREHTKEPRQCVLVGTTNGQDYLKDATGARRFWPIKLGGAINTDLLRADRDQLFAEAVVAYKAGEHWWPDEEAEAAFFKPQQDARFEVDAWQAPIEMWIRKGHTISEASEIRADVTTQNIIICALGQPDVSRIGTADTRRVGAIMRRLGWMQDRTKATRFWAPGPQATVRPPAPKTDGVVVELRRGRRRAK